MTQQVNTNLLCQNWIRSRREDTATEIVYRPDDYPLPLSKGRGRSGFEFIADGTFKRIGIGQTDISSVKEGTWQIDPANADLIRIEVNGQPELIKIQDLKRDRLAIKRSS